jgi:hypothetical protein
MVIGIDAHKRRLAVLRVETLLYQMEADELPSGEREPEPARDEPPRSADARRLSRKLLACSISETAPGLHQVQTSTEKTPGIRVQFEALLTDPWVFGSAWQAGAVAAEGEHGQGYECLRGAEAERDAGQESDFGVGGFDQSLR